MIILLKIIKQKMINIKIKIIYLKNYQFTKFFNLFIKLLFKNFMFI